MNGLNAILLMNTGKMVKDAPGNIYRVRNNSVEFSNSYRDWSIDECFDFSAEYEEYKPKPVTGWERSNVGESFYVIGRFGKDQDTEMILNIDNKVYDNANYFSTEEKAKEIDFKQTVFRKLQRFSDENGGDKIDWNDPTQLKWAIRYDVSAKNLVVDFVSYTNHFGQVHFVSEEVGRRALEKFRDDLITYFTNEWNVKSE